MKNLISLANKCMAQLDEIGIEYAQSIRWEVNTRAKKRWGLCEKHPNGVYTISISYRLLADDVADDGAINTIIHELLHTCKGCMNHGENWKREANKVNRAYGYNIKRCSSAEEKGVEQIESMPKAIKQQFRNGKYFCFRQWNGTNTKPEPVQIKCPDYVSTVRIRGICWNWLGIRRRNCLWLQEQKK